jgi:putative ABC transport system ATP-binding protein
MLKENGQPKPSPDIPAGADVVIETRGLTKVYTMGQTKVHALAGVDVHVYRGEMIAIMGASGSGKSTLMNIIGCLDYPSGGEYTLDGIQVNKMNKRELADIRNQKIGFIFQGFNLLSRTTAIDNVELPLLYDRTGTKTKSRQRAIAALQRVGLGDRLDHEPSELSGGQQQRVAIARALVTEPAILLADEPTGNLDSTTTVDVMALFQELNDSGMTVLIVTHENEVAQYAKRIVELRDGKIIRDEPVVGRHDARADLRKIKGVETVLA